MVEHFGGYWQYMEAPYQVAKKHELVWWAEKSAQAKQQKKQDEEYERQRRAVE